MDSSGARVHISMDVKPNKFRRRNEQHLSIHVYEAEFFLSTVTKALEYKWHSHCHQGQDDFLYMSVISKEVVIRNVVKTNLV